MLSPSMAPATEARLLVVDPDAHRRAQMFDAVHREGYQLLAIESADDVLRHLELLRPDLVLLSLDLGRIGGAQLCGELRAREVDHHTPVVLVGTGQLDEATLAGALLAGADDFVPSPLRAVEIRARVRVHLRYKQMLNRLGALRQQRDHLRREALFDPLTGLLNRRGLEDAVNKQLHDGTRFAALFIDIDHFKRVNDTFGHGAGDEVLRRVGACMRAGARQHDVCARYGGEEFVMLLSGADSEVASAVAERHRRAIEALRFEDRTLPPSVTVSIGAAAFDPAMPESSDAFLERADHALYAAKSAGRNRVVVAAIPQPPATAAGPMAHWEERLVHELHGGRAHLPILPDVASEVLRVAEDPRSGADSVARIVERSPPIAARLLAMSNSALYAGASRIGTLRQAVARLGLPTTRDLLLQIAYESSLAGTKRYVPALERIFQRCVVAAVASRTAGRELGIGSPYDYLVGLLHDIGEAHVVRLLGEQGGDPLPDEALRMLASRHHCRAGAQVLRAWKVPEELVEVALHHHDLGIPRTAMLRLARISDAVSEAILGADAETNWLDLDVEPAKRERLIQSTKVALKA